MDTRKYQLFKTELCRNWQEMGECRYGKKCRFAHGQHELKSVMRHARYKTEICKTFHLTGTCLYGVRCTFLHDENSSLVHDTVLYPFIDFDNIHDSIYSDHDIWDFSRYAKRESPSSVWTSMSRRYSSSSSSSSTLSRLLT